MIAIQASEMNKNKHKIELSNTNQLEIDGHKMDMKQSEVLNDQLNNFLGPRRKQKRLNSSFINKLVSLRRRNLFIKDKKSAHFLFILVFTFFICWVKN